MVMTFYFKNNCIIISNINYTSIFTRTLYYLFSLSWKFFKMQSRRFIRAMFIPHCRKYSKFCNIRSSIQKFTYLFIFFFFKTVIYSYLFVNNHLILLRRLLKKSDPSSPDKYLSIILSGWGIIPKTFFSLLKIPAILSIEPFGLNCSSISPSLLQ